MINFNVLFSFENQNNVFNLLKRVLDRSSDDVLLGLVDEKLKWSGVNC